MKKFLIILIGCIFFISLCNSQVINKFDLSKDTVLYTVGYAHFDTQWRWDYQTSIEEYIPNTMKENFVLFEKYPDYIFNFSGSNRYKMMKEYYPKDYELVKKYVTAGRWFPCGSSVEENDGLVPSAESIFRQILYGNQFFKKEFNVTSKEYMVPDCFGFPASLPSILAHSGIKGFSTQKLSWGSAIGIPFNIGEWVGLDGNSVIAAFNPGDYVTQIKSDISKDKYWTDRVLNNGNKYGVFTDYLYYGVGDRGGAPTDESVNWIEKSIQNKAGMKVVSSKADQMFLDITDIQKQKLPKYKGDLLLTNHSAGSINSAAYMKKWNRKNELLAYSAEVASVIAKQLGGFAYPIKQLNEAWRLVLGAQFHDILPGTSIPRAYEFSQNDEVLAMNQFSNLLINGISAISRSMNTQTKGIPILVYNSLPFEREEIVEAEIEVPDNTSCIKILDGKQKEVPSQIIERKSSSIKFIFLAKVGSIGIDVYDLILNEVPSINNSDLSISENILQNNKLVVKINKNGDVESIFDKVAKKEILSNPIKLSFQYERPEDYPAWNMDWADRKKDPIGYVETPPKITIIENGPLRVALEIERESKGSLFKQIIRLSKDGGIIEYYNDIMWNTKEVSLKSQFPFTISNEFATYNWDLGTVQRKNNDSVKYEVPSHKWIELTNKENDYGVAILDDSKYGSDKPNDNMVRLTMLYTPGVRNNYLDQAVQDFGNHVIKFAIYPHAGDYVKAKVNNEANKFNQPLLAFLTVKHAGNLGKEYSFMKINTNDVSVSAIKKAEENDDIVLRIFETSGKDQKNISIKFNEKIVSAKEITAQEDFKSNINLQKGELNFDLKGFEPKSFLITLQKSSNKITSPKFSFVNLDYNKNGFSYDDKTGSGFDDSKFSYPAELIPENISSNGIDFKMGTNTNGKNNVLISDGQKISIPKGDYNSLYILASSKNKDKKIDLIIDNSTYNLFISNWSGFVGQWDKRLWDNYKASREPDYDWGKYDFIGIEPGYIKNAEVGWFTSHTHNINGKNEAYKYGYLFKYRIDLPKGAKEIILPKDGDICFLAMTLAKNPNDNLKPLTVLTDTLNNLGSKYSRYHSLPKPIISPKSSVFRSDSKLDITINNKTNEGEIKYTIDGKEPDINSNSYKGTFDIYSSCIIKAAIFKDGKKVTTTVSEKYSKSLERKSLKLLSKYHKRYPGAGDNTLIDGKRGSNKYNDGMWQAYRGTDLEAIVDLGKIQEVSKITLGCMNQKPSWIFLPKKIEILFSDDGQKFKTIGILNIDNLNIEDGVRDISLNIRRTNTKFIKIIAISQGKCPKGHPGENSDCWLFVDELLVE